MSETVTQIAREAPFMEAARQQNIQDAIAAVQARSGTDLPQVPVGPESELAGLSRELAASGVGSYAPYLQGAGTTLGMAGTALGTGAGIIGQGMQSMGYFPGAQQALGTVPDQTVTADMRAQQAIGQSAADTTAAQQLGVGAGQFGMAATQQGIGALAGTGGFYDPSMAAGFYNPFVEQVIDTQMQDLARQGQLQQQQARAQAVGAGAFGGSREGVMQAEIGRNVLDQQMQLGAQLRTQAFQQAQQQAQQAFEQGLGRQQQGAQIMGQLGTAGAQTGLQAAQLAGGLGQQQAQLGLSGAQQTLAGADLMRQLGLSRGALAAQEADVARQLGTSMGSLGTELGQLGTRELQLGQLQSQLLGSDVQRLAALGELEREQMQRQVDAQYETGLQSFYRPMQESAFVSDILSRVPSTQMTTTATTSPRPSTAQQVIGAGIAGLSALGGIGEGGGGGLFG
jgi:hypothetical protein